MARHHGCQPVVAVSPGVLSRMTQLSKRTRHFHTCACRSSRTPTMVVIAFVIVAAVILHHLAPMVCWLGLGHTDMQLQVRPSLHPLSSYRSMGTFGKPANVVFSLKAKVDRLRRSAKNVNEEVAKPKPKGVFGRAKGALLRARRRWGLGLVRTVVSVVVRIEMMAARDQKEMFNLMTQTLGAAREGVLDFTGKSDYRVGDITQAAFARFAQTTAMSVANYTGKDEYHFGDITKASVAKFTGKEDYEFGDITKTAVSKYTGQDEYHFGDITRASLSKLSQFFGGGQDAEGPKEEGEQKAG
eukprot:TRINITY_DN75896_c0_g1_i1.p1 TRINITY_DN75896_c0_g1~~TRINITY_DN75896_c0_g1_i1.p1  ORF type:complete len:299 (+),score=44.97 TRINITY_DN75896_c0_g1_i1:56-952(+)